MVPPFESGSREDQYTPNVTSTSSVPSTMKAVGVMKHGDLEVIEDLHIPTPLPKDDEVLIKVHWGGVNFIDTYERAGLVSSSSKRRVHY